MPHYFTSTTDCAPQPLLARCKQVLSAVSAEGSALRAQSAAGKAATQPATSRAQAASATAAAPVTSRAQATGATAAPNRANTTAATPHHSRASTRSPSPPASAPSLNPQNQLSQHPAHNHTPQNQSSQHPVHNHTHLLHLTASLYTALAQSQCGADALLLTSTPSQHSTSKEAGSSSVSQQQREKKDSLLPSQRPVNNSTQAQKDSQLEACAREVVACQARLCFAGVCVCVWLQAQLAFHSQLLHNSYACLLMPIIQYNTDRHTHFVARSLTPCNCRCTATKLSLVCCPSTPPCCMETSGVSEHSMQPCLCTSLTVATLEWRCAWTGAVFGATHRSPQQQQQQQQQQQCGLWQCSANQQQQQQQQCHTKRCS